MILIYSWGFTMTKMLLKPHQYSTYMRYAAITTDGWNRLISNPPVIPNKDEAPLLIWGKMQPMVEIDPVSQKPRCIADNVGIMYCIQADIDNGCKIEEFVRDFHRYSFQLYTTTGYGIKEGDRFRVIFPLAEPIMCEWLVKPVKDRLKWFFSMCDSSCFDQAHWQIIPCILSKNAPYRFMQHEGERLSFKSDNFAQMAQDYKDSAHWKREIAEADRDPSSNHQGALNYVQKIFDETMEGSRDRTVYSHIMWLKETVGCDYGEVVSLRAPIGFDREYIKKVDRLYGYR